MKITSETMTKKFGKRYILENIDWNIDEENWLLFGANGSGKTTLLSILAGYERPTSGRIFMDGYELNGKNREEIRAQIGFVSRSYFGRFFHTEPILDIILSGKTASLQAKASAITLADVRLAKDLLDLFGLGKYLRYGFSDLSKGQQQCVLIARAFMNRPQTLLLDEPCGGLDLLMRQVFLKKVEYLAETFGTQFIYVTHHTEEILPIFQKGLLLKDGRIHSQGMVERVFNSKNLSDFFKRDVEAYWQDGHLSIELPKNIWQENQSVLRNLYQTR